jgi:hypothetical protein
MSTEDVNREALVRWSAVLDDMIRRVERAEDQIINATNAKEKDHAMIRYETVRDILSAYDRKAAMSSNESSSASPAEKGASDAR